MEAERLLLVTVTVAAGVVLLVLGRKQRAGTLRRNRIAGLRTSETLRSEEAWQAAHSATSGSVTAAGSVQLLAGAAAALPALDDEQATGLVLGAAALTLALVLAAAVRGHRIAARVNRGRPPSAG